MNSDMEENLVRVVLDTNIIISAFIFGGKPRSIFKLVEKQHIIGLTSPTLIAELNDTFIQKFHFSVIKTRAVEKQIKKY